MKPTFCLFAENCTVFDRQANVPGLSRGYPLCEGCRRRAESEFNLLRIDYVDLTQLVAVAPVRVGVNIARPKPQSKPPVNESVTTLRDHVAWVLERIEVHLRAAQGDRPLPPCSVREGYGVNRSVLYLQERVDALSLLPAVRDAWHGAEPVELDGRGLLLLLRGLHRRARVLCGTEPPTLKMAGECPQCRVSALRRTDGESVVWCGHCRAQLTGGQYLDAIRLRVKEDR